ncbi:Non-hem dioxygenase N-terminal domain - like 10 [Theobroma cacao]|nr:Non-hem dioxygenase N-terminal domain - like 10 [Theobroma cacao]
MAIPVLDFSQLNGEERAKTLAQIANACEEWGFFQLVNHGIPEELLERVKKVSTKFYKLEREDNFKNSKLVNLLDETGERLENVDWEDVITLLDDNEWPSKTPGFERSIASFYNPSLSATIAPAPQLVEKTNQQVEQTYPKFVFGDYMSVYVQQKFLPKEPRFQAVRAM